MTTRTRSKKSESEAVPTTEVSERVREQIMTPQPYVSRVTFKLGATIPTGDYANLTPSLEITYDVPEGATPPQSTTVLDDLRGALVDAVYPMVINQVNRITLTPKIIYEGTKDGTDEQTVIRKHLSVSPLFVWLLTTDPTSAAMIVGNRLDNYHQAIERAKTAATPKTPVK